MSYKTILPLTDGRGYETLSRDGQSCQRWSAEREGRRGNVFASQGVGERRRGAKRGLKRDSDSCKRRET